MGKAKVIAASGVVVGLVGWLVAGLVSKQAGLVIFLVGFVVASTAICVPTITARGTNWFQRGIKIFTVGFLLAAIPASIFLLAGSPELADSIVNVGIGVCALGMIVVLANWREKDR